MMVSDECLIWQGLSPQEYGVLGDESKKFVDDRSRSYLRVKLMRDVLEVLMLIRDDIGLGGQEFVNTALLGSRNEARGLIIEFLNDYHSTGSGKSVEEFFNTKYKGKMFGLLNERIGGEERLSIDHRAVDIALLLSDWEDRTPEKIMQTEMDVIKKIMSITDENLGEGLTDSAVTIAAEKLVSDEFHEASFHLEALREDHRGELLKRALKVKD